MSLKLEGQWNFPTTIWFGVGKIKQLPEACNVLNLKHPLIVTDPYLATLPMVKDAVMLNTKNNLPTSVFSDIKGNPNGDNVLAGVEAFHENHCDGVIALGGGSALDVGKTIALMVGQDRPLWDFEDKEDNFKRVNADSVVPIIAIPTTSGTGSEVGRAALIVDTETQSKKTIFHSKMMPSIVIADPALTIGVPAKLTAATGMDALAHNLEALCAPGFHPMAEGIAFEGIRLIKDYLPIAVKDGGNLEARSYLMAAATMGATAFQKGLGAVHSLSHPVGAIYDAHHGLLNAIFMPYVLKFNRPAIEDKMARLARFLDLSTYDFDAVFNGLLSFSAALNIPRTLRDINVDIDQADEVARQALNDGSTPSNPVPLTEANLKQLFIDAVEGNL